MAKVRTEKLRQKFAKARGLKKSVMQDAFEYFRKLTPIKTGNARRNTRLNNDQIQANYQYAEVLDKGRHMTPKGPRGSAQAPRGMSQPTLEKFYFWIKKYMKIGR